MKLAARAIIIHDRKVLLVKHKGRDFYSLPGGKVDHEEDMRSAMRRELYEELGIVAEVGPLLFVHEFRYPEGSLSLEFFFWIENGQDFLGECQGEFAVKELCEVVWLPTDDRINLKPSFLNEKLATLTGKAPIEFYSEFGV